MKPAQEIVLVVVTVVAATAWAVTMVADGGSAASTLPAVTTAALAAVAGLARSRSGLPAGTPVLPLWFVPTVVLVSAGGAVVWGFVDDVATGTGVGVSALVMASPAAAILAVPLAYAGGTRRARAQGARLGSGAIEAAGRVDTLVLEKDGTVTTGDLTVVSVDPVEPDHDRNLRWFAGALEKASEHRVGRAVATLSARGRLSDVEVVAGHGIRGCVDRHPVRVGAPGWIGIETAPTIWTTVGVEVDGRALGTVTVADDVRPDLTRDMGRLTALGLDVVLVSGDTAERTHHVAALADIETVHAACSPENAAEIVRSLTAAGRTVATAGTMLTRPAALTFTSSDEAVGDTPVIVVDDLSPSRIAGAIDTARATDAGVRRASRVSAALGLIGVAAAMTGVGGPLVAAVVAVLVAGASAAAAS